MNTSKVNLPDKLPSRRITIPESTYAAASTRITGTMTVDEARRIERAQRDIHNRLVKILALYLNDTRGVNITSKGWVQCRATYSGNWNRGKFLVEKVLLDERSAPKVTDSWEVSTAELLRYARKS